GKVCVSHQKLVVVVLQIDGKRVQIRRNSRLRSAPDTSEAGLPGLRLVPPSGAPGLQNSGYTPAIAVVCLTRIAPSLATSRRPPSPTRIPRLFHSRPPTPTHA